MRERINVGRRDDDMGRLTARPPLVFLIALLAIASLVGLLVICESWTSATIDYRFCNVVVNIPPEDSEVKVSARPKHGVLISTTRESALSLIIVDPESGELEREDVRSASEKQLLDEVMEGIRVVETTPEFWPYTQRTQVEPEFNETEYFRYRRPDPGAGLVTRLWGSHGGGVGLSVENCRSHISLFQRGPSRELEVEGGEVHPDDRAAFDTFIAGIEPR